MEQTSSYAGILAAFVSLRDPLATILVAILLGGILSSDDILQRSHNLLDATVLIFQGIPNSGEKKRCSKR